MDYVLAFVLAGSSPHARGALLSGALTSGAAGIIPACAGSTSIAPGAFSLSQDHPRMRGEHDSFADQIEAIQGSSPRMRGALASAVPSGRLTRIIPACAGSTSQVYNPYC